MILILVIGDIRIYLSLYIKGPNPLSGAGFALLDRLIVPKNLPVRVFFNERQDSRFCPNRAVDELPAGFAEPTDRPSVNVPTTEPHSVPVLFCPSFNLHLGRTATAVIAQG